VCEAFRNARRRFFQHATTEMEQLSAHGRDDKNPGIPPSLIVSGSLFSSGSSTTTKFAHQPETGASDSRVPRVSPDLRVPGSRSEGSFRFNLQSRAFRAWRQSIMGHSSSRTATIERSDQLAEVFRGNLGTIGLHRIARPRDCSAGSISSRLHFSRPRLKRTIAPTKAARYR